MIKYINDLFEGIKRHFTLPREISEKEGKLIKDYIAKKY
jgi:hypothetical protein